MFLVTADPPPPYTCVDFEEGRLEAKHHFLPTLHLTMATICYGPSIPSFCCRLSLVKLNRKKINVEKICPPSNTLRT